MPLLWGLGGAALGAPGCELGAGWGILRKQVGDISGFKIKNWCWGQAAPTSPPPPPAPPHIHGDTRAQPLPSGGRGLPGL